MRTRSSLSKEGSARLTVGCLLFTSVSDFTKILARTQLLLVRTRNRCQGVKIGGVIDMQCMPNVGGRVYSPPVPPRPDSVQETRSK